MSGPGASVSKIDAVKKYMNVVASKSINLRIVARNFYGGNGTNRGEALPVFGTRLVEVKLSALVSDAAEFGFADARQTSHANFFVV